MGSVPALGQVPLFLFIYFVQTLPQHKSHCYTHSFIIIINPLSVRIIEAPQIVLQLMFSISSYSPLPSGTCRAPGLSIPGSSLPASSFARLVSRTPFSVSCKMVFGQTWWTYGHITDLLRDEMPHMQVGVVGEVITISRRAWLMVKMLALVYATQLW